MEATKLNAVHPYYMIQYLQSMLDKFNELKDRYGKDDDYVLQIMNDMIACKEMVEALIGQPVNLTLEGKVTVGF